MKRHGMGWAAAAAAVVAWTGLVGGGPAGANLITYDLFKTADFTQTSEAGPTGADGYRFNARVFTESADDVGAATVSAGPPPGMLGLTRVGTVWEYADSGFADQAGLDAAYPNGSYEFAVSAGTLGDLTDTLELSGDYYPLATPYFTGGTYPALQGMDPNAALMLTWEPMALPPGADAADIFLTIYDDTAGALALNQYLGAATAYNLAAGTLVEFHDYRATLFFSARKFGTGFGGAAALAAYDFATTAAFRTVPEPGTLAVVLAVGAMVVVRRRGDRKYA